MLYFKSDGLLYSQTSAGYEWPLSGPVFDARLFGAEPNSASDQRGKLQQALDYAAGRGALWLAAGTYPIGLVGGPQSAVGLHLPSNTHLILSPGADIVAGSGALSLSFGQYYLLYANAGEHNIVVEGGLLTGDLEHHIGTIGQQGYGISLAGGVRNVLIRGVTARRFWGDGLYIGWDKSIAISAISATGGIVSVQTATAHDLSSGDTVYIAPETYDTSHHEGWRGWTGPVTVTDADKFTFVNHVMADDGGTTIYRMCIPNRDIHIVDCICDENRRQGMSVISAHNLYVEHCTFRRTGQYKLDTANLVYCQGPAFGIDLEPNHCHEALSSGHIIFNDCLFEHNAGGGLKVFMGGVQVKNCKFIRNATESNVPRVPPVADTYADIYQDQINIQCPADWYRIRDFKIESNYFDFEAYQVGKTAGKAISLPTMRALDVVITNNTFKRDMAITDGYLVMARGCRVCFQGNQALEAAGKVSFQDGCAYGQISDNTMPNCDLEVQSDSNVVRNNIVKSIRTLNTNAKIGGIIIDGNICVGGTAYGIQHIPTDLNYGQYAVIQNNVVRDIATRLTAAVDVEGKYSIVRGNYILSSVMGTTTPGLKLDNTQRIVADNVLFGNGLTDGLEYVLGESFSCSGMINNYPAAHAGVRSVSTVDQAPGRRSDYAVMDNYFYQAETRAITWPNDTWLSIFDVEFTDDSAAVIVRLVITTQNIAYEKVLSIIRSRAKVTLTGHHSTGIGHPFAVKLDGGIAAPHATIQVKQASGATHYGVAFCEVGGGGSSAAANRGFILTKA